MKIKKSIRFELLISTSFIMLFCLVVYVNFNLPVFNQIIANRFYTPIETDYTGSSRGKFSCIAASCVASRSVFRKNNVPCYGNSPLNGYTYSISQKTYLVARHSYINSGVCNAYAETVYYFPIFPSWSVIDNSMPSEKYWTNFISSTKFIVGIFIFYMLISLFILKMKIKPDN